MVSLVTARDTEIHSHKRKVWDQAFSIRCRFGLCTPKARPNRWHSLLTEVMLHAALETLEPTVYKFAEELIDELKMRTSECINISQWFEYYTFDLMAWLGFSLRFDLLHGRKHAALELYNQGHRVIGLLTPVPWLFHLTAIIPYAQKNYRTFLRWTETQLRRKINVSSSQLLIEVGRGFVKYITGKG